MLIFLIFLLPVVILIASIVEEKTKPTKIRKSMEVAQSIYNGNRVSSSKVLKAQKVLMGVQSTLYVKSFQGISTSDEMQALRNVNEALAIIKPIADIADYQKNVRRKKV